MISQYVGDGGFQETVICSSDSSSSVKLDGGFGTKFEYKKLFIV